MKAEYLQAYQLPNNNSELSCYKIVRRDNGLPIGFIYVGIAGMSVDWIAFADGYVYPKVDNIIDAVNAIQDYLDKRWSDGSLMARTFIN
jgi:hypothetical protein